MKLFDALTNMALAASACGLATHGLAKSDPYEIGAAVVFAIMFHSAMMVRR